MGVGTSIVVFAIGAILRFATNVHSSSFNIQTIGDILMIVGVVGFVVSLFFWASWGGIRGGRSRSRTVYQDRTVDPVAGRRVVGRDSYGRPLYDDGYGRTVVEEERRSGY